MLLKCLYITLASGVKPQQTAQRGAGGNRRPSSLGSQFKTRCVCPAPGQLHLGFTAMLGLVPGHRQGTDLQPRALPLGSCTPWHHPGIAVVSFPLLLPFQNQEPGPGAGGDPTHLFLNVIVSKANHYTGDWELFCRCRHDKKILFWQK